MSSLLWVAEAKNSRKGLFSYESLSAILPLKCYMGSLFWCKPPLLVLKLFFGGELWESRISYKLFRGGADGES